MHVWRQHAHGATRSARLALAAGFASLVMAMAVGWQAGRHTEAAHPPPAPSLKLAEAEAATASRAPALPAPQPIAVVQRRKALAIMGVVEVCGFGLVQVPPDDPDPVQRIPTAVRQSALDAMDGLMLASDDAQVRAAALWMGARLRGRDVSRRVEQVARLALASQDPFIYAMAIEACKGHQPNEGGSCLLLSKAQWVRLDPDNAVPWRALAAEAHERDQPQAEDQALQFAARASRNDMHAGRLPLLVDQALGTQVASLQRTLALSASWSAEAVWTASHGQTVGETAQGYDLSCDGVDRMQGQMARR
jgi:hypothetical protein